MNDGWMNWLLATNTMLHESPRLFPGCPRDQPEDTRGGACPRARRPAGPLQKRPRPGDTEAEVFRDPLHRSSFLGGEVLGMRSEFVCLVPKRFFVVVSVMTYRFRLRFDCFVFFHHLTNTVSETQK